MTSKEALTICKEIYTNRNTSLELAKEEQDKCDEDTKYIWNDDIDYLQSQVDFYERIIQDLEMLELLKSLIKTKQLYGFELMLRGDDEKEKKIREWLEK